MKKENVSWKEILFLLVTAAALVTVCSKSSVLYPFNDWIDANCFFTVGKSMMNGKIIYRDIYEQKGPLLYFLYGVAWLISQDSFLGAYLLEIGACFFFLYYSYRILRMYCGPGVMLLLPFWAALLYGAEAFSHGGSAEELCLPVYAYAIFVSLKSLKYKEDLSVKTCFWIGLLSGGILWIKFTMLGMFVGWILVPAGVLIRKGDWKKLLRTLGVIFLGVCAATLPFLLYFGLHHAVRDWMEAYVYNNIFLYSQSGGEQTALLGGVPGNLWSGLKCTLENYPGAVIFIIIGEIWLFLTEKRQIVCHINFMLLCSFLSIFIGGRGYIYYPLILGAFSVWGAAAVWKLFHLERLESRMNVSGPACVVLGIALAYLLSSNTYLMKYKKEDMPQYQLGKIICAEENPTLLQYGSLDAGFYTVCNLVPTCKYFCGLNIPLDEIRESQNNYVEDGRTEFVVVVDSEFDFEPYEFVAEWPFWFEGRDRTYYLYRRK